MFVHVRLSLVVPALVIAAALAGCGGSGPAKGPVEGPAGTSGHAGSSASSAGPSGVAPGASSEPPAAQENARVPATFAILPGRRLQPHTVTAPAGLPIQVTVAARDGRRHTIRLGTPVQRTMVVLPGAAASVRLPGQRAGRYPLLVDGVLTGALIVGGAPGP